MFVLFDYSGVRPSQRRAVVRAVDQVHPDAHSESMRGFADATHSCALRCASAGVGWGGVGDVGRTRVTSHGHPVSVGTHIW